MKERGIVCYPHEVRGILDRGQTQLRRIMKPVVEIPDAISWQEETSIIAPNGNRLSYPEPGYWTANVPDRHGDSKFVFTGRAHCPYGTPGDRLWVRETYHYDPAFDRYRTVAGHAGSVAYRADIVNPVRGLWKPSIHMPRWASRITLEITDVRVQRLQAIGAEDAEAEGSFLDRCACMPRSADNSPIKAAFDLEWCHIHGQEFRHHWKSINGEGSWAANPWVWALTFKVVQ